MRKLGLAILFVPACAGDTGPTVAPAWDGARLAVAPAVRGHNTVWSRGGLGLWDEAAGDVDAAAWPHVEALRPGALRFPGGTRGLRWHFAQTIGPAAQRAPQCDTFLGELDATTYGLGEMLRVADRAGAPISLMTAFNDGTAEEAAAMLAYATALPPAADVIGVDRAGVDWQTTGAWAQRREADGAPRAEVMLVEIGNEPYLDLQVGPPTSCGRPGSFRQDQRWEGDVAIPVTAADYAAQVRAHADALRRVDPDVVIGAAAMSEYGAAPDAATAVGPHDEAAGDAWNPRLAADAGDAFDVWILHPYDFSVDDARVELAERARATAAELRALDPDKQIAVTEFGTLFDADSMLNAILTADFVRVAVEEQWLATFRHILIEDDPAGPFATSAAVLGPDHQRTPGWHASHLLATHLRSDAVPVEVIDADGLAALATINGSGEDVAIVLIDRRVYAGDPVRSIEVRLPAGGWSGTVTQVTAAGLLAKEIAVDEVAIAGDGAVTIDVPPTSLTVVRVAR